MLYHGSGVMPFFPENVSQKLSLPLCQVRALTQKLGVVRINCLASNENIILMGCDFQECEHIIKDPLNVTRKILFYPRWNCMFMS